MGLVYRVRLKICGVTNIVDARMVEREGADAIGFVFWPQSPRVISASRVAEITRVLSPLTVKVGVFYDAGVADVERNVRRTGLNAAQICGTPPGNEKDWKSLSRRIRMIRVVTVNPESPPTDPPWPFCNDYLFDSGARELPGGADPPFDWSLLPKNKDWLWGRIHVSGGLTAQNVGDLIRKCRPDVLNVSAAVEGTSGRKDPVLLREFLSTVREAEYEVSQTPLPVEEEVVVNGNEAEQDVEEDEDVEDGPQPNGL
jgi:phosphoribosylanthranilate isomerase